MKRSLRIAIAEDEPLMGKYLVETLTLLGYQVIAQARSGKELVACCREQHPDLVITDIAMPDLDGLEAAREIYGFEPVPIIIISARGQEKDKIAGLDAGADDYLTKPFGVAELKARLRVALRHAERPPEDVPPVYKRGALKVDLVARHAASKPRTMMPMSKKYACGDPGSNGSVELRASHTESVKYCAARSAAFR